MKIIDKINASKKEGKPFYSFEYFPPKTEQGLYNLYERLDRMVALEPAFIDITWGAGGSTADLSLEISKNALRFFGVDVMMHLTCTEMSRKELIQILAEAKEAGIHNILALRGDPPEGQNEWKHKEQGLRYGSDLTKLIRDEFGDDFSIGVGAYPEGHVECLDPQTNLEHLKIKMDAGADFIITQLFYDMETFYRFVDDCRAMGIDQPIIPGIMPIHNYERFDRFTSLLKIAVPDKIRRDLEKIKDDDSQVIDYGIELGQKMSQELIEKGFEGLHFYTLNLETSVSKIIQNIGLASDCRERRSLPWRKSAMSDREEESVRPIFWSNRPKSYLTRTRSWDDFPNGRWGDSRSPSFGALDQYYLVGKAIRNEKYREKCLANYGYPKSVEDVSKVFLNFCTGQVARLPWCEIPVQAETRRISEQLTKLNASGFLTINSQPQIDSLPSSDPVNGWGGAGGFISQKAYLEFFTSKENLDRLLSSIDQHPSITFQAVNREGNMLSNTGEGVNAVTWGVFPGKEIVQPTVVDSESFLIWKDEAFGLWKTGWSDLYEKDSESEKVLEEIASSYYLVNVVENDYKNGDIFSIFPI